MGICKSYNSTIKNDPLSESTTINNVQIGAPCVPLEKLNIASKVVCKINFYNKVTNTLDSATGFFMDIYPSFKCLLTNYHTINEKMIDDNLCIEISNPKGIKEKLKLNKHERYIKFFDKPIDITIIQIKTTDKVNKLFESLQPDLNYQNGFMTYKGEEIFIMEYPKGRKLEVGPGKISEADGFIEQMFYHDIFTEEGSSGSPVISISNLKVIGIHTGSFEEENENRGTFIGCIFSEINKDIELGRIKNFKITIPDSSNDINNIKKENNYISAEIEIDSKNINKDILIINSYEESKRRMNVSNIEENLKNEEEIKQCQIKINNEKINFSYVHNFKKAGRYTIYYIFKNKLTNTNHMFSDCSLLASISITKLVTENITNMSFMFADCVSLINVNLSYCNVQNVTNMKGMFYGCTSLSKINFEKIETKKIEDLSWAFYSCSSLTDINLTDFDTEYVEDLGSMFSKCSTLININLSHFNTENVTNMTLMFSNCTSLRKLDLSKFDTRKIKNMNGMFSNCLVLSSLDISNFIIDDKTGVGGIFYNCHSLNKNNVICNDKKIMEQIQ